MNAFLKGLDLLGAPLFVLQPGNKIRGKFAPPPLGWPDFTADGNERRLSSLRPGCGFGMVCGHVYDVLDFDPRNYLHGVDSLKRMAAEGLIPHVYQAIKTPRGGWHLYIDPLGVGKRGGFLPGVDLQAAGSFVFVPPTAEYEAVQ